MNATEKELAAVDLGSNSFHLVVGRLRSGGDIELIDRIKEPVRLAEGLFQTGELSKAAQKRALDCLRRFRQRLRNLRKDQVRVVGTNALRKVEASSSFLQAAEEALGHRIHIIRGREEARLIYLGMQRLLPGSRERRLVFDIGGGSTELMLGQGETAELLESANCGCVGYTEKYFPKGRLSRAAFEKAKLRTLLELRPLMHPFRSRDWDRVYGCSGTILAVGSCLEGLGLTDGRITATALEDLTRRLGSAERITKPNLPAVSDARRQVLPGGLGILRALFEAFDVDELTPVKEGMRLGMLVDLVGKRSDEDPREQCILDLASRYGVDRTQARRVERTVLCLFDQTEEKWKLRPDSDRRLLRWAAILLELGLAIAHLNYHKHGSYLIAHSDLPGFSRDEQRLLARLIGCHRKRLKESDLEAGRSRSRKDFLHLAVLLRLAFIFHRSREAMDLGTLKVQPGSRSLRLMIDAAWRSENPLISADLDRERKRLSKLGFELEMASS